MTVLTRVGLDSGRRLSGRHRVGVGTVTLANISRYAVAMRYAITSDMQGLVWGEPELTKLPLECVCIIM